MDLWQHKNVWKKIMFSEEGYLAQPLQCAFADLTALLDLVMCDAQLDRHPKE